MRSKLRSKRLATFAIVALALGLRALTVMFVVATRPPAWFFARGQEMGLLADSLVHGLGLSSPFGMLTGPTAIIAPGYPLLVAVVFRMLGSYTRASSLLLMALHLAANALTIWLMLHLARQLATERRARIAAIFWACSPPLLWMPTIFWETSLSCCFLLGFSVLALRLCRPDATSSHWVMAGSLCGVAGLLNPALLPSLLALLAFAVYRTRRARWRNAALALLVFAVVFAPWPLRNARVFGAFIPTRTTVGLELWMGNREGATGYLDESVFPTFNPAELAAYGREGELAYTTRKGREGRAAIAAHPAQFARLTALRMLRFWSGTGSRGGSWWFAWHALLTTALGLAGLGRLLRLPRWRGVGTMLALPLLLFPLPYYITHAEFRYRLVIDTLLTVLAAAAWPSKTVAAEDE